MRKPHTEVRAERVSPCWSVVPDGLEADGQVQGPELEFTVLHLLGPPFVHPLWFE